MKKLIGDATEWVKKNRLITVLAVLLVLTVLAMACRTYHGNGGNEDSVYALLRDLASGLLVAIGAVALLRRADSQDEIAKAQDRTAQAQNKTAEAQNITAKAQNTTAEATLQSNEHTAFKDSVEFLAHPSESVRLGGIYSLYELAIQDHKRRKKILEILCAHIRSKTNETEYRERYKTKPSEEISSLLKLLASKESALRKAVEENKEGEYILKFRGAFLNGVNFPGAWLVGADLREAQMRDAYLPKAQMQKTKLQGAQMQEVYLQEAQMQKARFRKAQMQGARLLRGQMQGAFMEEVCMQGANLKEAMMQGADLSRAKLHGADLERAHMQGVNLRAAQLQGVNFRGAKLHGVSLVKAQMQIARLHGTELQGAILMGTQLQGADLKHVNIRGAGATIVTWTWRYEGLETRMEFCRGKDTKLPSDVIFAGGLSQEDKENIGKEFQQIEQYVRFGGRSRWFEGRKSALQELDSHIGIAPSHEIPQEMQKEIWHGVLDSKAVDKIIEGYKKAIAWEQDDNEED